ncbi:MAG: glycerophosphodiester phosphodiesterase [Clostridia bacterium]|nr:glycerophosphodiester phosphodiesterase [Clostridia bacterium]
MDRHIFIEGHRGFCAMYPENTLLSYEKAIDLGVDAFEFDIWLSKDKVPVLMHDGNVTRTCGRGGVCAEAGHLRDKTLGEIKALDPCFYDKFGDTFEGKVKVPTLRELLDLVARKNPGMRLGVEIKEYTEETVDLSVAMLKEYGIFERCWFYAFNGRIIRYLKEKYNAVTMGYPYWQMQEFDGYDAYDEIGLSMSIVKSDRFDEAAALGLPMHLYCADTEEDVRLCIEKGASLITANDPRPLMKVLGKM